MEIVRKKISIRNLVENYEDNGEDGIFGFNKKLDIRPPYQREFVYDSEKRSAVIDTVIKGFPLNTMYWANKENDEFEIIDGDARRIRKVKIRGLDEKKIKESNILLSDEET